MARVVTITNSPNLNSTATSFDINYTITGTGAILGGIIFRLYVNGVSIREVIDAVAPSNGSYVKTISLTTTDQAEILNEAYGSTLSNCLYTYVSLSDGVGGTTTDTSYGNLTIKHGLSNLSTASQTIPMNLNASPLVNIEWDKPVISGLPSDGFVGKLYVKAVYGSSTFYTSTYLSTDYCLDYLNATEIANAKTALGAFQYDNLEFRLDSYFKTGSSTYTLCNVSSLTTTVSNALYEPKTLTITNSSVNFTETGTLTVNWTGMKYRLDHIELYAEVNGQTWDLADPLLFIYNAGVTSGTFYLPDNWYLDAFYDASQNYDFVDAIQIFIIEYSNLGAIISTANKAGGDTTIANRLTSYTVSTVNPLNLDSPTNIVASWTRPVSHPAFRGSLGIYVNDILCATMTGSTGVNEALTTDEKNAMIAAMSEVSPGNIKYVLTTQFDTGATYTSLTGTQTVSRTGGVIKTFYFKSTGTLTPFSIASSLSSIAYSLTINTPGTNHTLLLKVNGTTIKTVTGITDASGTISIDSTDRTAILNACPTGINTATLDITTYVGAELVGTSTSAAVAVTIGSEYVPVISSISSAEVNTWVTTLCGKYLQGKSNIEFTINNTPSTGSTISSYRIVFGAVDNSKATNDIQIIPTTSGSISLTGYVTDSRGRTASYSATSITVAAYSNPTISYFDVTRATDTGGGVYVEDTLGTACQFTFTAAVSSVLNGSSVEVNDLWYRLGYKIKDGPSYTYYTAVDTTVLSKTLEKIYKTSFTSNIIYECVLEVYDNVYSGTPAYIAIYDSLPAATVTFLWGDNVASVGKIWEEGTLDVGGIVHADGDVVTETQFESKVATGTAPLIVASTTMVENLNVELLDGQQGTYYKDITASGTGTNNYYVKYADGTLIKYGTATYTGTVSTAYGNLYSNSSERTSTFDTTVPFTTVPSISISFGNSGNYTVFPLVNKPSTTGFVWWVISGLSRGTSQTYTAYYTATGRWD